MYEALAERLAEQLTDATQIAEYLAERPNSKQGRREAREGISQLRETLAPIAEQISALEDEITDTPPAEQPAAPEQYRISEDDRKAYAAAYETAIAAYHAARAAGATSPTAAAHAYRQLTDRGPTPGISYPIAQLIAATLDETGGAAIAPSHAPAPAPTTAETAAILEEWSAAYAAIERLEAAAGSSPTSIAIRAAARQRWYTACSLVAMTLGEAV